MPMCDLRRDHVVAPFLVPYLPRVRVSADAFLTAARNCDFEALLEALDPDVVVRSNGAEAVRGAAAVAGRALAGLRSAQVTLPALIHGAVGLVTAADGRPLPLIGLTITGANILPNRIHEDPPPS